MLAHHRRGRESPGLLLRQTQALSIANVKDQARRAEDGFSVDMPLKPAEEPLLAAHLVTPRALYSHHGIYVGQGRVIHYAGLANGFRSGPVEEISLQQFAYGRRVWIRQDARRFDRSEVVQRARSRLGERCYRILTNNCEHFCVWALRDEYFSEQVERLAVKVRAIKQTFPQELHVRTRYIHRPDQALVAGPFDSAADSSTAVSSNRPSPGTS